MLDFSIGVGQLGFESHFPWRPHRVFDSKDDADKWLKENIRFAGDEYLPPDMSGRDPFWYRLEECPEYLCTHDYWPMFYPSADGTHHTLTIASGNDKEVVFPAYLYARLDRSS